ncbi:MAG TPA: amidohydrolase family protein [Acetobacteraceae bacterium]|nr:amidohydrolase family protein [Acetobacteraceae bacterium]
MPAFDLVIRNGTVIDGSGAAPIDADIGITGNRIAAVGTIAGSGAEEIDAKGKLVTPGFVDIHTHYDAQAVWDSHLAPSSWHGVTTAVIGNCGVGFAPCKPADREKLVELMEGVEDIPGAVMHEGLQWEWESFPQYLDALERRPRDIDICALLPHAAVRVFVMGDRAINLENANQGDIADMREIARQAMLAGAFGFSTSRSLSHKTLKGDPTPTLRAQEDELTGIAMGMRDAGTGMLEIVSEWAPDHHAEFAMVRRVTEASGRPTVFTLTQRHKRPEVWRDLLRHADDAIADGVPIRPVVAPRAVGVLLGLTGSQNPFSGTPTYKSIAHLPLAERVRRMRDPAIRAQILSEDPKKGSTFPLFHRLEFAQMFRFGNPPNYQPRREDSLEMIAAREGRTPQDVAYDALLEDDGNGFIYTPLGNYAYYDLTVSETTLADRNAIMGLGDGGAHVAFILDAGYQTWLLDYWGKQRKRWDIPELVRRLTSDTASAAGLLDRGVLAVGKKADVNVIDFDRLGCGAPYVVSDLPAGGKRLLQKVHGYEATIVSGKVTFREGVATEALPGRLVRGMQAALAA